MKRKNQRVTNYITWDEHKKQEQRVKNPKTLEDYQFAHRELTIRLTKAYQDLRALEALRWTFTNALRLADEVESYDAITWEYGEDFHITDQLKRLRNDLRRCFPNLKKLDQEE